DGDRFFMAGHGQAAHRLHRQPGPTCGGGVSHAHSGVSGHAKSACGHWLYPAGSTGPPWSCGMSRVAEPLPVAAVPESLPARMETRRWRRFVAQFASSKSAVVALVVLVLAIAAALLAPWLA